MLGMSSLALSVLVAAGVPAAGVPAAGVPAAGVPAAGVPAAGVQPGRRPPRVVAVVLGTAQDAGVPQANDRCERCEAARADPEKRRFASSLALIDAAEEKIFLIDATPDFKDQLSLLGNDPTFPLPAGRTPLAGILLTHAHIGHYAGLIHLDRAVMSSNRLPVYATERMGRFITDNAPWSELVRLKQISLVRLEPGKEVALTPNLRVTPVLVPHRDELSDTVAYFVDGPARRLLWLPDIDKWEKWSRPLEEVLREVDYAFLDATFYSGAELPDRDLSKIPHPLVINTSARVKAIRDEIETRIFLIHMNHSNPLLGPTGDEHRDLEKVGIEIATKGQRIEL